MGRYTDWAGITGRYPELATGRGSAEVESSFIVYAEANLDSRLGTYFAAPFSSNNLTIKDLAIDLSVAYMYRFKDKDKSEAILEFIDGRIADLITGKASMVTTSGDQLGVASAGASGWSTTMDYHPVFGLSPPVLTVVSSQEVVDERAARGDYGY